jgi:hypothetical protein
VVDTLNNVNYDKQLLPVIPVTLSVKAADERSFSIE